MNVSKGFVAFVMLTVTLLLNSINVTTSASSGIHIRQENASRSLSTVTAVAAAAAVVSGALDVDARSAPDTLGHANMFIVLHFYFPMVAKRLAGGTMDSLQLCGTLKLTRVPKLSGLMCRILSARLSFEGTPRHG